MYDSVIADVGSDIGEWYGIYGDPYSDLGVDMFSDLRLDDIPAPGPRAAIPTASNVVTQAVAQKVASGQLKNPEKPLTKPVAVIRKGVTPRPKGVLPRVSGKKVVKLLGIGLGAIVLWELLKPKR